MVARAQAAELTGDKIFQAAHDLWGTNRFDEVTLQAVASRAGVTLQTVLRRFGSKEALFAAAAAHISEHIKKERVPSSSGPRAAVHALVASYEGVADVNWNGLVQEDRFAFVHEQMEGARTIHRTWLETAFADALRGARGVERRRRLDLLFCATDFYQWKLLRRDLGRSQAETCKRMLEMVNALFFSFANGQSAGGES